MAAARAPVGVPGSLAFLLPSAAVGSSFRYTSAAMLISRRDFVALTAAGAVATPFLVDASWARASVAPTAQDIVDRIRKNIGVEWGSDEVDTFKAGDPLTPVTGVVATSMATLDVLQKAVQSGANLIITAAPTFYSDA